jgi:hypothetical protein
MVAVGDMDFPPRGLFHPHKTATPARQYQPAAGGQSAASMARINHFGNWQIHDGARRRAMVLPDLPYFSRRMAEAVDFTPLTRPDKAAMTI